MTCLDNLRRTEAARRRAEAERRLAMVEAYVNGASAREVAERFGVKLGTLRTYFSRWGVRLPQNEVLRRMVENGRETAPKRTTWPDCPPHLREEYETLCRYMPKREARAQLEKRA